MIITEAKQIILKSLFFGTIYSARFHKAAYRLLNHYLKSTKALTTTAAAASATATLTNKLQNQRLKHEIQKF